MLKKDFKIFEKDYVYLDSAASAQKPQKVLDKLLSFYQSDYANVHRGSCELALKATKLYEEARQTVADFIRADSKEIVFTKGATEAINLVAASYAQTLKKGDEVLVCIAEHHANFVPWQQACILSGATFKTFNVLDDGRWDLNDFEKQLTKRTKVVAVAQLSNVLGVVNPVEKVVKLAHKVGAKVMLDVAQSIAHMSVDVKTLDCDYMAFSGHKIYGPNGIGVLYGKCKALNELKPYQFGGDMVDTVRVEKTTFADVPARFEAGTPPIANAVGLAEALKYVNKIGFAKIQKEENGVFATLIKGLKQIKNVEFLGNPDLKTGLVAFNVKGIHADDLNLILAKENVCVRVGHHCAMPLHARFGVKASLRVSLGLYNDSKDIEKFLKALKKAIGFFK
ncbi:MAG: SufS family cysteine desulfurase [Alphaproteobacteria bacterium]|nr:SufS family cysteine desulfurase [Alphaproteobacteria bacterium]